MDKAHSNDSSHQHVTVVCKQMPLLQIPNPNPNPNCLSGANAAMKVAVGFCLTSENLHEFTLPQ